MVILLRSIEYHLDYLRACLWLLSEALRHWSWKLESQHRGLLWLLKIFDLSWPFQDSDKSGQWPCIMWNTAPYEYGWEQAFFQDPKYMSSVCIECHTEIFPVELLIMTTMCVKNSSFYSWPSLQAADRAIFLLWNTQSRNCTPSLTSYLLSSFPVVMNEQERDRSTQSSERTFVFTFNEIIEESV